MQVSNLLAAVRRIVSSCSWEAVDNLLTLPLDSSLGRGEVVHQSAEVAILCKPDSTQHLRVTVHGAWLQICPLTKVAEPVSKQDGICILLELQKEANVVFLDELLV